MLGDILQCHCHTLRHARLDDALDGRHRHVRQLAVGCAQCVEVEKIELDILYLLIPLSVILVFLIAVAFWWSVRNGQFDDLEGPAYQILMDDD